MNYKIKTTEQNREAIKDIANRNGMNIQKLNFTANLSYIIHDGMMFCDGGPINESYRNKLQELTFEQFKEMFDKEKGAPFEEEKTKGFEETELDKWLKETKAKNLSYDELRAYINSYYSTPKELFKNLLLHYNCEGKDIVAILFSQWNETKPQGKIIGYKAPCDLWKGDIKQGTIYKLLVDTHWDKDTYCPDKMSYSDVGLPKEIVETWEPVFEETQTEKSYKDKVIELIEEKIKDYQKSENEYSSLKAHFQAQTYKDQAFAIFEILKQIKELN